MNHNVLLQPPGQKGGILFVYGFSQYGENLSLEAARSLPPDLLYQVQSLEKRSFTTSSGTWFSMAAAGVPVLLE